MISLIRDLCTYATGVVAPDNAPFFERIKQELHVELRRYPSGSTCNGWLVPESWKVHKAVISRRGAQVFNGRCHSLGVATYSRSFQGDIDLEDLKPHLVTYPSIPHAYMYHCMWQYRPWDTDWAFCMPFETYRTLTPGQYRVDLVTSYEPGEMLVAEYEHEGRSDRTIVFNAHTCHPHMANDDFAGVAMLIRLFQWLKERNTYYTYRLVLGPEHLGTVFYLHECTDEELQRFVGGAFAEMPGTRAPIKLASSFLGDQGIDRVFRQAIRQCCKHFEFVPWRKGAGNDETVWEAPGYEVPFVEVSRSEDLLSPYPEYHTSLDGPELMDEAKLDEFLKVFTEAIEILEKNASLHRTFNGLICLSNPEYRLYRERPDPAVQKELETDSEKWGYLLDCLLRYFDGSMTLLDIAEKHGLSFDQVFDYILKFQDKGLVKLRFAPIERTNISRICEPIESAGEDGLGSLP